MAAPALLTQEAPEIAAAAIYKKERLLFSAVASISLALSNHSRVVSLPSLFNQNFFLCDISLKDLPSKAL